MDINTPETKPVQIPEEKPAILNDVKVIRGYLGIIAYLLIGLCIAAAYLIANLFPAMLNKYSSIQVPCFIVLMIAWIVVPLIILLVIKYDNK